MKLYVMTAYAAFYIVMSIIAIALYGVDKHRAKKGVGDRIKEKTLLFVTVYGGAAGAFIGSEAFRHKTKKGYFTFIIVLSMILQTAALAVLILNYGGAFE